MSFKETKTSDSRKNGMSQGMEFDPTSADAVWKKIQQNTFTRWCNEHLRKTNTFIHNLERDLCDGIKLILLLEVVSQKRISKYNKKPSFPAQKLENVNIALKFIDEENIKLVNIDSSDICKGNLKLILGLIWTLILKYQISMPMMDDEDNKDITPKQALMGWVKSKLPADVRVNNFTTDWNTGVALAALVDSCAPGLLPEWEDLDPKNGLQNVKDAMKVAEDWLGVPQVLSPEDLVNPNTDELSVMTYISYFPEAKAKPNAPIKPKLNAASKSSAYGPGIEPTGNITHQPTSFHVNMPASCKGKLDVRVFGPSRKQLDCTVQENPDETYTCTYTPERTGIHDVHVRVAGHHIPRSPFRTDVASDINLSKVQVRGPGIQPTGLLVNRQTYFEVVTIDAGTGDLQAELIEPRGGKRKFNLDTPTADGVYLCEYTPTEVGKYTIVVRFGGKEVPKSPFHMMIEHPAAQVKVYGKGIEPGLKTGSQTSFTIDCSKVGPGNVEVISDGPGRTATPFELTKGDGDLYTCTYTPNKPGGYQFKVLYDKVEVPHSPFKVSVGSSADTTKMKVWGPGLDTAIAGLPAEFYIDTRGGPFDRIRVTVSAAGGVEAHVEYTERPDGTLMVKYICPKPGDYIATVHYEEVDIGNSPYRIKAFPAGDASKCYAEGPGLKSGIPAGRPVDFTVFCKNAGYGDVNVKIVGPKGVTVEPRIIDRKDGTYHVTYSAPTPGNYTIEVLFAGQHVKNSPVSVDAVPYCDPRKVKVTGAGLKGGLVGKPAEFQIDTRDAGEGGLGLTIEGPEEALITPVDNGDGTCAVQYVPPVDGDYTINVTFADQHVPGSPFKAVIQAECDPSKVVISGPGLESGNRAGRPCMFEVDATAAGKATPKVEILDDMNMPLEASVTQSSPGVYAVGYTPKKPGAYKVTVTYGGKPVPRSPVRVKIEPASDASKVKLSGPGLEPTGNRALCPLLFTVDCKDAGDGVPEVVIEQGVRNQPSAAEVKVDDNGDGTFTVTYVVPKEGQYAIMVKFGGVQVPKSPVRVKIDPSGDPSRVKVYGTGVEPNGVRSGEVATFTVDTKEAGVGDLAVSVEPGRNLPPAENVTVVDNHDNTFTVSYVAPKEGMYSVVVKYAGGNVPRSPFKVNVALGFDASKCKLSALPDIAAQNVPVNFTVDASKAGKAPLTCSVKTPSGNTIPATVVDNGDGTFAVSFTPEEVGPHEVTAQFGGKDIPGCPSTLNVVKKGDASKVKVFGPGLSDVFISRPTEFTIDTREAGFGTLGVNIEGPVEAKVISKDHGDGTCTIKYTPPAVGDYTISVTFSDEPVPNSPFTAHARLPVDASKVRCSGPGIDKSGVYSTVPTTFNVNTKDAGESDLEVIVTDQNEQPIPVTIEPVTEGISQVTYTAPSEGRLTVAVKYGGEQVPLSPFKVKSGPPFDSTKVKVKGDLDKSATPVGEPMAFTVDCSEAGSAPLSIVAQTPTNKTEEIVPKLTDKPGVYLAEYTPKEAGPHQIKVKYGNEVPRSPFRVKATPTGDARKVKISGPGITSPRVDVPAVFTADCREAGKGQLFPSVRGPNGEPVPISTRDNGDGTVACSWTPTTVGPHTIDVLFGGEPVKGSPFAAKALPAPDASKIKVPGLEDLLKDGACVGHPYDLPVDAREVEGVGNLQALLTGPSGQVVEPFIQDNKDGTFLVNLVPEEVGPFTLDMKYDGVPLEGSPYTFPVHKGASDKVRLSGSGLKEGIAGQPSQFTIDTRSAGPGDLALSVEGPAPAEIICCDNMNGTCTVSYLPKVPGEYDIVVKHADEIVPGCPSKAQVAPRPHRRRPIGSEPTAGKKSEFGLPTDTSALPQDLKKLSGSLASQKGSEAPVEFKKPVEEGILPVVIQPQEAGLHHINVKKDGKHIEGSPFPLVVNEPEKPIVDLPDQFCFAAPGVTTDEELSQVTATVVPPSGKEEPVLFKLDHVSGGVLLDFVPKELGKHLINIKKNRKHIEGSPFELFVVAPEGPVGTQGRRTKAKLKPEDVDLSKLDELSGFVEAPSGKSLPLYLGVDNDSLVIDFKPEELGRHLVNILRKNKHISGSPFEVIITAPEELDGIVNKPTTKTVPTDGLVLPRDLRLLNGVIKTPSGKQVPVEIQANPDNTSITTKFVPTEIGKHKLHVYRSGIEIKGSPFTIIIAAEPESAGTVGEQCSTHLAPVDLDLPDDISKLTSFVISPSGRTLPSEVSLSAEGSSLDVKFVPEEFGRHMLHLMKDGQETLDSPMEIYVVAPEEPQVLVGQQCTMSLEPEGLTLPRDLKNMEAYVVSPSNKKTPASLQAAPNNKGIQVQFSPTEPGRHHVHLLKNGKEIPESPIEVLVGEGKTDRSCVGSPCQVGLDSLPAEVLADFKNLSGSVTRPNKIEELVEMKLSPNKKSILVEFLPKEPGKHLINIKKAGKHIEGSPFPIMVSPSGLSNVIGQQNSVTLPTSGLDLARDIKLLKAVLTTPSGLEEPVDLKIAKDKSSVVVDFVPKEFGKYIVSIFKNGKHIEGSPFALIVSCDSTDGAPSKQYQIGLEIPELNLPADLSALTASALNPDKQEIPCKIASGPNPATLLVDFVPDRPGEYTINILKNGKHVAHSPFRVLVSEDQVSSNTVGSPIDLTLDIPGLKLPEDLKLLKGTLAVPSGMEEPVMLQVGPQGSLLASFVPKEVGQHWLHIKKSGKPVQNSPFPVMVEAKRSGANKVKVTGPGLKEGNVNKRCEFKVDTTEAGTGSLSLSIDGPDQVEIHCVDNEDGTCIVDFTPTKSGVYTINVLFDGEPVPGAPFRSLIRDASGKLPVVEDEIQLSNQALAESAAPDQQYPLKDFVIKFSGSTDLFATVTRPSGIVDNVEIVPVDKDSFSLRFTPNEIGPHYISVMSNGTPIKDSPFLVNVEMPPPGLGALACHAYGPGLESAVCCSPATFTVNTIGAGPGGLAIAVQGPTRAEIDCHDNHDGTFLVKWYPQTPGEYAVHISFAEKPIPGSPFRVPAYPADGADLKIKEQVISVGQPAAFAVQMHSSDGHVHATIITPSGMEQNVQTVDQGSGNYSVRFIPMETGTYLVNVFFNNQHIPGSPFKVQVVPKDCDPGKVIASGMGLVYGYVDTEGQFIIDARQAGSGALALSVDGPAKVRMNCVEQMDGTYLASYTPPAAGEYEISINFGGQSVPGSPFRVPVLLPGQAPFTDASKCRPDGPGLCKAVMGEPAAFTVNASEAGRGSLLVGVEGPKIPAKEILVRHTGQNIYTVNYVLEEPGLYVLKVMWGDQHIPGSPFKVTV